MSERRSGPLATAIAASIAALALVGCGGGDNPGGGGDFVTVDAPADQTGGYIQAMVAPGMGTVRATIYDGAGQAELGSFVADAPGAALSFYWATAPGQQTRVALRDEGGAAYTYDMTTSYTPVADPFEPNDSMGAAAAMPDGGQMSAYLFAGAREAAAYDDYYRFTAQSGTLSIRLDQVPPDIAARLFLFRSDGSEVARVSSGMRGGALSMTPPALAGAEELTVRVSLWSELPAAAGVGSELPASYTQPYLLTVSQVQP